MKVTFIITFMLASPCLFAQNVETVDDPVKFILDYYSDFSSRYDLLNGQTVMVSDNYKASFSGSIFTLTYDTLHKQDSIQNQTISLNLKEVISIDFDETYQEITVMTDISFFATGGKLIMKTNEDVYDINIRYSMDDDDYKESGIYKAFVALIKK